METAITDSAAPVSQELFSSLQESQGNEGDDEVIAIQEAERLVVLPYIVLSGVISVTLNGSLLYIIFKFETLRTKPLFSILGCQVFCDLCTPVIYVPVAIYILKSDEELGRTAAVFQAALRQSVSMQLPLHILTLVTVERYVYICNPFRYEALFSMRKVRIYLVVLVLLMVAISTAMAMSFEVYPGRWQLSYAFDASSKNPLLTAVGMLLYGVWPAVIQARCFLGIGRAALRQGMAVHAATSQGGMTDGRMTKFAISKAVSGVMRLCGIYWITWAPAVAGVAAMFILKNSEGLLTLGIQIFMRYVVLGLMTVVPVVNPLICLRNIRELKQKWLQTFRMT